MLWRVRTFPDFCEPCLPSQVERPPSGPDWLHEIKHDGFRLLARRGAERVRLFTRNGHDWNEVGRALGMITSTLAFPYSPHRD
jgi:ATP-dependent DNA ligase